MLSVPYAPKPTAPCPAKTSCGTASQKLNLSAKFALIWPLGRDHGAREVVQTVWAKSVALPDGRQGFVQATCIVAKEMSPPAGEKPIEWRLLTNLSVETLAQAQQVIGWYLACWEIEMLLSRL